MSAQFMLLPDPLFSKTGAVTKIKYNDHFKRYKMFIVKHLESSRMKGLIAQFNVELFPADPLDHLPSPLSTGGLEVIEDEDDFSHAFNDNAAQSTSTFMIIPTAVPDSSLRWENDRVGYGVCFHSSLSTSHPSQTNHILFQPWSPNAHTARQFQQITNHG